MNGRNGTERDRAAGAEDEAEEEMDDGGESEVKRDGGEEEGPGGTPRMSVAPSETNDGGVLRQPVCKIGDRHDYGRHGRLSTLRRNDQTAERGIHVKVMGKP